MTDEVDMVLRRIEGMRYDLESSYELGYERGFTEGLMKVCIARHREGPCSFLVALLRGKFAEVPAAIVARVEAADRAAMQRWCERLIFSETVDEVFVDRSARGREESTPVQRLGDTHGDPVEAQPPPHAGTENDGIQAIALIFRYLMAVREAEEFDGVAYEALGLNETCEAIMKREAFMFNQGRERGIETGQRTFLLNLLRGRFSQVPQSVVAQVETADAGALERWSLRLLTAGSVDVVFAGVAG